MRIATPLTLALLMAIGPSPAAAKKKTVEPCSGRYVLQSGALPAPSGGSAASALMLAADHAEIEGWCTLGKVAWRQRRNGVISVRSRFARCGDEGMLRLKGSMTRLCDAIQGVVVVRRHRPAMRFRALRFVPRVTPEDASTFGQIERQIFATRGCSVSTCHGADAPSGLDLRKGLAYDDLVGVPAWLPAAAAAGRLRVVPGDVPASFLSAKLHGDLGPDDGVRMPSGRDPLPQEELDLVDAWIAAGAPRTGVVEGAPPPPPDAPPPGGYQETPPPGPPPPGGFQLYLEGPVLQPGEEQEGCLWVAPPTPVDVPIAKVEVALNPGTHHFTVWVHSGTGTPPLGQWLANDIACIASGASFGEAVAGAAQAPYVVNQSPPGIAGRLPGGRYLGMNAHYYNEFDVPIQIKVWTTFYPYVGTPQHYTKSITSLDSTFTINVPPFTTAIHTGRYVNASGVPQSILGVGGHMHKRGLRFSIWHSNGTKILDDYDWAHPTYHGFSPPYVLAPGDWFDYECEHDNGVTRPVRTDAYGNPVAVVFGVSAEDEMCILTGGYYDD